MSLLALGLRVLMGTAGGDPSAAHPYTHLDHNHVPDMVHHDNIPLHEVFSAESHLTGISTPSLPSHPAVQFPTGHDFTGLFTHDNLDGEGGGTDNGGGSSGGGSSGGGIGPTGPNGGPTNDDRVSEIFASAHASEGGIGPTGPNGGPNSDPDNVGDEPRDIHNMTREERRDWIRRRSLE